MTDLAKYLEQKKLIVESSMKDFLPKDDSVLAQAMNYSALAPGKRIRAFLVLESALLCGGAEENVMPAACAIEFIHAFSLIHDDLPAMDDDDLRRGLPTCHKKFTEAVAILAGDALFALAYKVIAEGAFSGLYTHENASYAVREISRSVGFEGMCEGQSMDLISEGRDISYEDLRRIHEKKTGELIQASIYAGAKLADAGPEKISSLLEYGRHIGLAFQIKDDILDVVASTNELGKSAGADIKRNKATYPSILGMEKSAGLLQDEKRLAISSLRPFGDEASYLAQLAEYIIDRKK
jgi:geranylgeranyl diphosphate synthase, type II